MIEVNKLIYQGYVTDNQDPLMLGRIRALPVDQTDADILPADWNPEKDKWTSKDPLMYLPLLPYYISQVPKIDEYIHIFYYNRIENVDNTKFYIQGPITRPQNNGFEDWHNSESMLANGTFLKQANNIKDSLTFKVKGLAKGIYPEPGDNALMGRGTADIIVKENDVLIRAGKNLTTNKLKPRLNRSFLQISNFDLERVESDPIKKRTLLNKPQLVKKLVEWEITDEVFISGLTPGGEVTGSTFYNGSIKLYSLTSKDGAKSTDIKMDTPLDDFIGNPEYVLDFEGKTLDEGVKIINQFISGLNNGKINVDGYDQYPFNNNRITNQFPFYFRPTKNNIQKLSSSESEDFNMVNNFFRRIKLLPSDKEYGSVLVSSKNIVGQQLTPKRTILRRSIYTPNPVSYGTMAADFVYLLSHKTNIPSKRKIDLKPKETLYGIPQEIYTENVLKNTDPMVRGDELMKLLKLIVDFLASHVHNINEAPIQKGLDGTQLSKIYEILDNSNNSILNQNIRIN